MTENRDAMFREAQRLQRLDQVPEAIAAYQRALLDWPEHANSWFNLGLLFRQARRPEEALLCYQQALNLGIASPEQVHLNRGVIYADYLRQDAAAERELRTALSLDPGFVPALLNLANIQGDRGRRDEALELYRRVLQLDPLCTLALARYANMQAAADCDEALIGQLQTALARPAITGADRVQLGFALGRVLDARGSYEAAFSAYAAANAAVRAGATRAGLPYDRRALEQFIDRLIKSSSDTPAPGAAPAGAGPTPVFVCGMFRSGSTLAEQLLAQHPGVAAGGELDLLPLLVAQELSPFPESLASKTRADLDPLAGTLDEPKIKPSFNSAVGLMPAGAALEPAGRHLGYKDLNNAERAHISTFFSLYFLMSGLHGLFVLVGMGLIIWVLLLAIFCKSSAAWAGAANMAGLYFQLVTLIWFFVFPLFYLIH